MFVWVFWLPKISCFSAESDVCASTSTPFLLATFFGRAKKVALANQQFHPNVRRRDDLL